MRRFILLSLVSTILIGLGFASVNTFAAPPTTAPALPKVNALIQQLGSDDAGDRDTAQKQLVDLGDKIIPQLKKAADDSDDPEIRSRAAAALAQMKDLDSNGVSLITVHLKDVPVDDATSAIGQQAHATFQEFGNLGVRGAANATVTLDADRKPFWDVMTDLCTQLSVCPSMDASGRNVVRLFSTSRNWMTQSPHQIVGPYWIGVSSIYRTRTIDLLGPPVVDDQFMVRLVVLPEPKLAVTQMSEFVVKEATDSAGHSLMPRDRPAGINHLLRSARQMNHNVETHLFYPDQPGKKIATLRGEVTVMLAQDMQQFQVDDVLGNPKVTNPLTGCKIDAKVLRQGNDLFRVTIQCTREGLPDDQWSAMLNHMNDMTLEDADGHALASFQTSLSMASGTTDTNFTATSLFSRNSIAALPANRQLIKTGDAKKLTWNVATSVKPVVIPVTFKDLPMP
jgi:hypothetical protein